MSMTKSPLRPALALFLPLLSTIGLASPSKADTAEPTFKRVLRDGTFEIRDYDSQVVAEVRVPEGRGDPASAGFRPLARYIFGGNKPRASIAMTAPVTRQQEGQSIAMGSSINLPSGLLTLRAKGGDLNITGSIKTENISKFADANRAL